MTVFSVLSVLTSVADPDPVGSGHFCQDPDPVPRPGSRISDPDPFTGVKLNLKNVTIKYRYVMQID